MRVHVRCTGIEHAAGLVEHTKRRIHQHLSRFGHRLRAVEVRLADVNGPRGGRDKRCLVTAHGAGLGNLRVEELHEEPHIGVERALERLEEAVGRSIARVRERRVALAAKGPATRSEA
jgi:ribosome-associated translation inhibitor RaiA